MNTCYNAVKIQKKKKNERKRQELSKSHQGIKY